MASRVTVIIPTYDRPDLVTRAVDSVLGQTYRDFECVVVDDNSPGTETKDVVTSIQSERLTYVRHDKNRGSGAARNTGLEHVSGEFVAFLDDDDEWLPNKLEKQLSLFETLPPEYGLVYCWMDYINAQGDANQHYRPTLRGYVFPHVLDGQRIGACSTLLVRTRVVEDVGGFDASLPRGVDGDFIRRVCRDYKVDYVPETLVRYHTGHGYQRITRFDERGIRNAIQGKHTKLRKFPHELDEYPRRKANVYAGIAYHHSQLAEWGPCKEYYIKAVRTSPISFPVYVKMLRSLYLVVLATLGRGRGNTAGGSESDQ